MTVCTDCGGTVIEYDAAAGNGFCVNCGTVVEENTIVNEVTFGETSNGAAMVQGSFVGQGATHARMGGPFGNRGSSESREQTIANATRKIQQICHHFRLSDIVALAASRLYTLALEHKFTRGRRSMHVVAVCVYVACRQKETRNYMLIDFSDLLQVNVFELGHTYLQLVRTLNLRLPPIDPSHHISRFAALLEFGDETARVAVDATRLVARMDRDWLARGRRPSGICGAALLLAARMNNFRRSIAEVVQVVKIADSTVRKRLEEFKRTGSAALSVGDFRSVWLEEENEPPAFVRGREKEERERMEAEMGVTVDGAELGAEYKGKRGTRGKGKKRKRKRDEDSEDLEELTVDHDYDQLEDSDSAPRMTSSFDPAIFNEGILQGTVQEPLFLPDDYDHPNMAVGHGASTLAHSIPRLDSRTTADVPTVTESNPGDLTPVEASLDAALAEEVSAFLGTDKGVQLSEALDDADAQRAAEFSGDEALGGLDEEELDAFILTEEEVRMKERVWVEMNRDYLENLAAKAEQEQLGGEPEKKKRKKRKTANNKPRDASTPNGATAAESVRNLIKKNPRYSKRINYDALRDLFDGGGPPGPVDEKVDMDKELWTMEQDLEDDSGVVVEEGGGGVGITPATTRSTMMDVVQEERDGEGEPDDEMYADVDDKGDEYAAEWDVYEQEA